MSLQRGDDMLPRFESVADGLIQAGRVLHERGWVPAASGNLSQRLDDGRIAITVSGRPKGQLTRADITVVHADGRAIAQAPSAETLLHAQIYRHFPDAAVVLHTHAMHATVLSRRIGAGELVLRNYELLKAFPGIRSHEVALRVPIVQNDQNMSRLVEALEPHLQATSPLFGYLIAGHGLYTWGKDFAAALMHCEAFEYLFACELATQGGAIP
jgi:methylthioribulose-1-phosphate dehydratase